VRDKLRGEGGFTLPEVLVSMVMMGLVLFALYAMFDAAVRIFAAGRDASEAAQNARQGLAKMEREIRAAYPRDRAGGDASLLQDFGETHVVFGNDLDGDRRISEPRERISYALNAGGVPTRNGVRLVEFAEDVDGDGRAMTFEYLAADGDAVSEEARVVFVRVSLEVSVGRRAESERVLTTGVALRNR
jgi:prepilin-type N-terminal cleavage/methylation domain-containing protein